MTTSATLARLFRGAADRVTQDGWTDTKLTAHPGSGADLHSCTVRGTYDPNGTDWLSGFAPQTHHASMSTHGHLRVYCVVDWERQHVGWYPVTGSPGLCRDFALAQVVVL